MLRKLDNNATPEEALEKYSSYRKEFFLEALNHAQSAGLFFDLYHPLAALRHYDFRAHTSRKNAEVFLQHLHSGFYDALCLRAPAMGAPGRIGPDIASANHEQPPHFAFDPDTHSLCWISASLQKSKWDTYASLLQCPGFLAFSSSLTAPSPADFRREFRARFFSEAQARAALSTLPEIVRDEVACDMRLKLLEVKELELSVLPPAASEPKRLEMDAALAERVAVRLDSLQGIAPERGVGALAAFARGQKKGASAEQCLDLLVLYLRRVHQFCFYTAQWCEDEWDLRRRCGAAVLRTGAGYPTAEGEIWAKAHEQRLESFLETVDLPRPQVPSLDDEPVRSRCAALCDEKAQAVPGCGKFQCAECGKHFAGPQFVHKHIRRKHSALLEAVRESVLGEAARENCLADGQRGQNILLAFSRHGVERAAEE